jgi:hypothetical protein
MKHTTFIALALFTAVAANAQTSSPSPAQPATDTTVTPTADTAGASATLVDTSVGKAYVSNPEKLKGLTSETLTPAHAFPALGTYKGNGASTTDVTITLDSANKGIVWVDGLPQGRFKALMKKAPSTYKIPMQTSANGKAVSEGTLYVNPETAELTIVLGRPYNDANPSESLTIDPKKKNGWQYTGVKTDAAVTPAAPSQQ